MPIRTRPAKRRTKKSKGPRVVYVTETRPPTQAAVRKNESDLEAALKRVLRSPAAQKVYEAAEKDPEAFLNGIKKTAEGVERLYQFFQQRPEEAKRATRHAVVRAAAFWRVGS